MLDNWISTFFWQFQMWFNQPNKQINKHKNHHCHKKNKSNKKEKPKKEQQQQQESRACCPSCCYWLSFYSVLPSNKSHKKFDLLEIIESFYRKILSLCSISFSLSLPFSLIHSQSTANPRKTLKIHRPIFKFVYFWPNKKSLSWNSYLRFQIAAHQQHESGIKHRQFKIINTNEREWKKAEKFVREIHIDV